MNQRHLALSIWLLTAAFTLSFSSLSGIAALEPGQPAKKWKVVVFGGHPDDPESGAGGLIATLTGLGHEVILAYGTVFRGDRQFFGRPEAEVRRAEASAACTVLGATPKFFPYAHEKLVADEATARAVAAWLDEVKPDIVVTHWPLDTHENHHAVSSLVWQCYQRKGGWNLYFFEVMTDQQTIAFRPELYLDIQPVRDIKRRSLEEHKSQAPAQIWAFHERMHRRRGAECGTEFAEAYSLVEAKPGCPLLPVVFRGKTGSEGSGRINLQILKELDAVAIPSYEPSKKTDQAYVRQFLARLKEATEKRAALILELYKADPDNVRIPMLMAERWSIRPYALPADKLLKEVDNVLAHSQDPKIKIEGTFAKTYARLYHTSRDIPLDLSGVDEYLKLRPNDPRGATLLQLAANRTNDEKAKAALEDRILRDFPDTTCALKIQGIRNQGDKIGKPFDLEFIDAVGGSAVSVKKLKGKVVVLDFWATWCGPCLAEMPEMKKLYAKYHDQGVEFIGVSLDVPEGQGGLSSLKKFVKDKEIAWPQYYPGNGWESEFTVACGINEIPAIFVVDTDGKLYSTEAHGKLDTMIPTLLKKTAASGEGAK